MSVVLGVSAYHPDAAAALLVDGQLAAAAEEERFTRIKHWAGFPREAIRACLAAAGVSGADVDHVAVGRNPRANAVRRAWFALTRRPATSFVRDRLHCAARVRHIASPLGEALDVDPARVAARLVWVEHHPAHQASAFFPSPFDTAAVAAVDGFGDFVSTSWALGAGAELRPGARVLFPHSLGLFYLALTQYLGFCAYGDEYKVMGLAACGAPDYASALRTVLRLEPQGCFALDLSYFRHAADGVAMSWDGGAPALDSVYTPKLEALLGPARRPGEPIEPRHEAIAASCQRVFEEALFHVLRAVHERTGSPRLCLAGGCALNSAANGKIQSETPFEEVFVPPAAGDSGTAVGAALWVEHVLKRQPRRFRMEHAAWGPAFDRAEIARALEARGPELSARGCRIATLADEDALCRFTARALAAGCVVGWFQGRMELGARALGHRSILADPRRPEMRDRINRVVKRREPFRPFAPSILEEALDEYFAGAAPDPFMTRVYPVREDKRSVIPAVVHVDGSGRPQTVSRACQPRYWRLIAEFQKLTGVPVLLNTSFNDNEPIVLAPADAIDCFLRANLDVLVLGEVAVLAASASGLA